MAKAILFMAVMMGLGAALRKVRFLEKRDVDFLSKFVVWIALPASVFKSMVSSPLDPSLALVPVAFWVPALVFVPLLYFSISPLIRDRLERATVVFCGVGGNVIYMGFPFLAQALGEKALAPGALYAVLASVPFYIIYPKIFGERRENPILGLIRFPAFWAMVLGLGLNLMGVEIPETVGYTISKTAGVTSPLAIFAIGATLAGLPMGKRFLPVSIAVISKLVLFPLVTVMFLRCMAPANPLYVKAVIVESAMPSAVATYLFSAQSELREDIAAESVLISTLFSFITLPFVVRFFDM